MADKSSDKEQKPENNSTETAKAELNKLEKQLDVLFGSKAPVQLPKDIREILVKVAPWLALIGGVIGLIASWNFWHAGHAVNRLAEWANELSTSLGGESVTTRLGVMWYLSLVVLVVQSLLMLAAYSGLKDRKKSGWNFLFYSSLVSVVLAVVYLFVPGYGFFSLVGTLVGTAISMFLLFQVRGSYK